MLRNAPRKGKGYCGRTQRSSPQTTLRNAPHTAGSVTADVWEKPYGRELAAFPLASVRADKYWPPVGRIDGAFGDRNLVCTCPPPEAFQD